MCVSYHHCSEVIALFCIYCVTVVRCKYNNFEFSDREGLTYSHALETMETDLCIALKCQLLLSHGDGTLSFAKAIEVLTSMRGTTTLYLDEILNAQVEIDSS